MFTEEICKLLIEKKLEIRTDFVDECGLYLDYHTFIEKDEKGRPRKLIDNEKYDIIFIGDDPYCSHHLTFNRLSRISDILNTIEPIIEKWNIVDNINLRMDDEDKIVMSLSDYLKSSDKKSYKEICKEIN